MQVAPFEGKRLDYKLRADASTRCPGTYDQMSVTDGIDVMSEPEPKPLPLLQRIAVSFGDIMTRRVGARAH